MVKAFSEANSTSAIEPLSENLVDLVWSGRPARPCTPVFQLDDEYTGQSVGRKLHRMRNRLKRAGSPGMVIGQLDEVAWLFNLRGSDIPYNPVSRNQPTSRRSKYCI